MSRDAAGGRGLLVLGAWLGLGLSSCATTATAPASNADVARWGAMREVLREGRTEGRVALVEVLGSRTVAVGATAGLAAEITVVNGAAHLAEVAAGGGMRVRGPRPDEEATLLVAAEVESWSEHVLDAVPDLAALEAEVGARAARAGLDARSPFPFRVEGHAELLQLHVLNGSCPVAHPDGPAPWRLEVRDEGAVLVGFHATDSSGVLTHHGRASHTHAVVRGGAASGHLDEVSLASGARLFLPEAAAGVVRSSP